MDVQPLPSPALRAAVERLRQGEVVAFPTETVYGLGADATRADAVARVFALKGRPPTHPLIVHLARDAAWWEWAVAVPDAAHRLAERFWPGPLTLVLPRSARVDPAVTGGLPTVGLRVPDHPVAQSLLTAFGGGIAAPSANRFGRISPTRAAHVHAEFPGADLLVLEGGDCAVGLESTIVDLSGPVARVLRPGHIGVDALREVLPELEVRDLRLAENEASPAPGTLASHYAPRAPLSLLDADQLAARVAGLPPGARVGVLHLGAIPPGPLVRIGASDARAYARALYAELRWLDAQGLDAIWVESPPPEPAWDAVRDRLSRAAAPAPR